MVQKKKNQGSAYNFSPINRKAALLRDDAYILERVDDQINWHKRKSEENQKKHRRLKNVETFVAAMVPVTLSLGNVLVENGIELSGYEIVITHLISAAAGVYLTISAGFLELEGYDRNAKIYKQLYRKLEGEKYKYLTRTEPYDEEDAYGLLIFNVENQLHQDIMNFFKATDKANAKGQEEKEKAKTDANSPDAQG